MPARRFAVADLPPDARLEVWADNTVWIVLASGRRTTLREWADNGLARVASPKAWDQTGLAPIRPGWVSQ